MQRSTAGAQTKPHTQPPRSRPHSRHGPGLVSSRVSSPIRAIHPFVPADPLAAAARKLLAEIERKIAEKEAEVAGLKLRKLTVMDLLGLLSTDVSTTVRREMEARNITPESNSKKKAAISKARQKHGDHKFVLAAQEKYGSVSAWAVAHTVPVATACSWYASKPIPRQWAEAIEAEFGKDEHGKPLVPATAKTWKHGFVDKPNQ